MMATNTTRLLILGMMMVAMTVTSIGTALGQTSSARNTVVRAQGATSGPKAVSRARQPAGTRHKASAFAPRPTKRRVFGAPIQPPIVNKTPPKESTPK